jgi:hypothetical protein
VAFDLESIYKSLIRNVQKTIQAIKAEGISDDLNYYAWDSRGEAAELDHTDLIGLAGWAFHENQGLWTVRSGITISTYNDENLLREIKMLNIMHDFWGEGQKVAMVDKNTGEEFTEMVVSDFDMMPSGNSEKRNYRPIGIELLRTGSFNG